MGSSVFVASSFWKRKVSDGHRSSDRTYVEVLENLIEAQSPSGDRLFILPRVEIPRKYVPFTPLD